MSRPRNRRVYKINTGGVNERRVCMAHRLGWYLAYFSHWNSGVYMSEHIISWGGGVNSTAIIALHLLGKLKGKPEIVFADTGCEYPETYAYINDVGNMLVRDGWKVTVLRPYTHREYYGSKVKDDLYQYLWDRKDVPTFRSRPCTIEYKKAPIKRYAKGCKQMIGICKDELKRIKDEPDKIYPVKDYTRDGCVWLIGKAGLPLPIKSGCYLCPFQNKARWIGLYENHRDLWDKTVALEENSKYTLRRGITIKDQMKKWCIKSIKGE